MSSRYHLISIEMPCVLEQLPMPKPGCCKQDTFNGVMIMINALTALSAGLLHSMLAWEKIIDGDGWRVDLHPTMNVLVEASMIFFNTMLMISGFRQIRAVLRVRSYFRDK